jgi:hypothetical protein
MMPAGCDCDTLSQIKGRMSQVDQRMPKSPKLPKTAKIENRLTLSLIRIYRRAGMIAKPCFFAQPCFFRL